LPEPSATGTKTNTFQTQLCTEAEVDPLISTNNRESSKHSHLPVESEVLEEGRFREDWRYSWIDPDPLIFTNNRESSKTLWPDLPLNRRVLEEGQLR
jgi:hypothetical protein